MWRKPKASKRRATISKQPYERCSCPSCLCQQKKMHHSCQGVPLKKVLSVDGWEKEEEKSVRTTALQQYGWRRSWRWGGRERKKVEMRQPKRIIINLYGRSAKRGGEQVGGERKRELWKSLWRWSWCFVFEGANGSFLSRLSIHKQPYHALPSSPPLALYKWVDRLWEAEEGKKFKTMGGAHERVSEKIEKKK